jgi:hypothetical protein
MIGFGNFGGQRNTSFPMRQNPPQERAVNDPFAGMGGAGGWESDWQNRFNEEASRERAATPGSAGTMVARPQTFDSAGYLAANPDVGVQSNWQPEVGAAVFGAGSGVDPAALHLAHWGASEGRGGSNFNEAQYLQLNPDVAAAVSSGSSQAGWITSACTDAAKAATSRRRSITSAEARAIPATRPTSPRSTPKKTA